jgi:hypothetical protein
VREVYITKANGVKEIFKPDKLSQSFLNSGASDDIARGIVEHISRELQDGMSTSVIYDHAFYLLGKKAKPLAARYSLRRALGELGPSGFPFEKFMASVFKVYGYQALNDQFVKGHCAEHEIDLVAWNENKLIMAEAKFHNQITLKSDLKVALYVKARFDDLKGIEFNYGKKRFLDEGWLITNTKFTDRAISYGRCAGLRLMGWNYPKEHNLHDFIEDVGLHPITCLNSISQVEKRTLIESGIVLCKDVIDSNKLEGLGFSDQSIKIISEEARQICNQEQSSNNPNKYNAL